MNPRLEKLRAERDRAAAKYAALGAKIKAMDDQILKLENTDIIGLVRENGVTIEQLAELMQLLEQKPTAAMPAQFVRTEENEDEE